MREEVWIELKLLVSSEILGLGPEHVWQVELEAPEWESLMWPWE